MLFAAEVREAVLKEEVLREAVLNPFKEARLKGMTLAGLRQVAVRTPA